MEDKSTDRLENRSSSEVNYDSCALCMVSDIKEDECGKFFCNKQHQLALHQYCMFFASGLAQNGNDDEGFDGFLYEDIKSELRRASKLKCTICHKRGAAIGCCSVKCSRKFHFVCAKDKGVLFQFFGSFNSYCWEHRRTQNLLSQSWNTVQLPCACPICLTCVDPYDDFNTLKSPCCKSSCFHRACIQKQALACGMHFFRCAVCNNIDLFQEEMKLMGIYIPDQDAIWEKGDAYADLLQQYNKCDAAECLCPKGREYFTERRKWRIRRCDICGQCGTHLQCQGWNDMPKDWQCVSCSNTEQQQQWQLNNGGKARCLRAIQHCSPVDKVKSNSRESSLQQKQSSAHTSDSSSDYSDDDDTPLIVFKLRYSNSLKNMASASSLYKVPSMNVNPENVAAASDTGPVSLTKTLTNSAVDSQRNTPRSSSMSKAYKKSKPRKTNHFWIGKFRGNLNKSRRKKKKVLVSKQRVLNLSKQSEQSSWASGLKETDDQSSSNENELTASSADCELHTMNLSSTSNSTLIPSLVLKDVSGLETDSDSSSCTSLTLSKTSRKKKKDKETFTVASSSDDSTRKINQGQEINRASVNTRQGHAARTAQETNQDLLQEHYGGSLSSAYPVKTKGEMWELESDSSASTVIQKQGKHPSPTITKHQQGCDSNASNIPKLKQTSIKSFTCDNSYKDQPNFKESLNCVTSDKESEAKETVLGHAQKRRKLDTHVKCQHDGSCSCPSTCSTDVLSCNSSPKRKTDSSVAALNDKLCESSIQQERVTGERDTLKMVNDDASLSGSILNTVEMAKSMFAQVFRNLTVSPQKMESRAASSTAVVSKPSQAVETVAVESDSDSSDSIRVVKVCRGNSPKHWPVSSIAMRVKCDSPPHEKWCECYKAQHGKKRRGLRNRTSAAFDSGVVIVVNDDSDSPGNDDKTRSSHVSSSHDGTGCAATDPPADRGEQGVTTNSLNTAEVGAVVGDTDADDGGSIGKDSMGSEDSGLGEESSRSEIRSERDPNGEYIDHMKVNHYSDNQWNKDDDNQSGINDDNQSGINDDNQSGINDDNQSGINDDNQSGINDGNQSGINDGNQSGINDGNQSGINDDNQSGINDDNQSGINDGNQSGINDGNQSGINDGNQSGINDDNIATASGTTRIKYPSEMSNNTHLKQSTLRSVRTNPSKVKHQDRLRAINVVECSAYDSTSCKTSRGNKGKKKFVQLQSFDSEEDFQPMKIDQRNMILRNEKGRFENVKEMVKRKRRRTIKTASMLANSIQQFNILQEENISIRHECF